jgi:hypothetical protein
MSSAELDNLVRTGKLKREPPSLKELTGLRKSAETRLTDAQRTDLSYDSRFDLAYNAAHALALFALRRMGYRSDNRYLVFQVLPHTAGMPAPTWRVLSKAHERRNQVEYEGTSGQDDRLLAGLIEAARALREAVGKMPLPERGRD